MKRQAKALFMIGLCDRMATEEQHALGPSDNVSDDQALLSTLNAASTSA